MPIKYVPSGDKFKASQLWGEGRHQLSILKNLMSFQGLKQLQRVARFEDGTIIKCLSCFDQDVVEVFVPLPIGEKAIMPKERIEIAIYPAFEAYDGNTYSSNFIGIVLCKGGGFEPPYEFIAKDSLPRDLVDEPKGPLPEERIWWDYYRGKLDDVAIPKSRKIEDVAPVGIAEAIIRNLTATASECTVQKGGEVNLFKTCSDIAGCGGGGVDCPIHYGRYVETYSYSRTESFQETYGFSYSLDGASCGNWPDYVYEGSTKTGKRKPCILLNFNKSFFMQNQGSGNNNFINYFFPAVSDSECFYTCTEWLGGICVAGFWDCDGVNGTQPLAAALINPQHTVYEFERRSYFYNDLVGSWQYSYREYWSLPYRSYGGVLNSNEYALIYSEDNKDSTVVHSKNVSLDSCIILPCAPDDPCCSPYECGSIITTGGVLTGALIIGLDTEVIQVKPSSELMYSNVRYHQVGGKSIGLFFAVENYPFEYTYIFASALEGETECIQTQVFDVEDYSFYHEIPGVTDDDDNLIYGNGQMRLIRETITRPEEPLNL